MWEEGIVARRGGGVVVLVCLVSGRKALGGELTGGFGVSPVRLLPVVAESVLMDGVMIVGIGDGSVSASLGFDVDKLKLNMGNPGSAALCHWHCVCLWVSVVQGGSLHREGETTLWSISKSPLLLQSWALLPQIDR